MVSVRHMVINPLCGVVQVLDQWLLADLRDLGHPVLPGGLSRAQKTELSGTFCVQVCVLGSLMHALILYLHTIHIQILGMFVCLSAKPFQGVHTYSTRDHLFLRRED